MTAEVPAAAGSIPVTRLRYAMGVLTLVLVVSFLAVGALASVVLVAVVGVAITALLAPGRLVVVVLAGLAGLAVIGLCVSFLMGGGPSDSWGDWLFLIGGGLAGIAVVALAAMALSSRKQS